MEAEAAAMGQSWGTLRMLAQDREQWKEFVAALIAYGKKGNKQVSNIYEKECGWRVKSIPANWTPYNLYCAD